MVRSSNLGFPRMGAKRELKRALEAFWKGESPEADLLRVAAELRARHWKQQEALGITQIPSNDFSLYDHVLDTAALVGAVPARYGWTGGHVDVATYFAMARGQSGDTHDVPAMEMTKWFDTNYHYIVPEFHASQTFRRGSSAPVDAFIQARDLGIRTRPVLLGPLSFLLLGKAPADDVDPLDLLDRLLPVYDEVLSALHEAGADWVQIDEPCLVQNLSKRAATAYTQAYARLGRAEPRLLLTTYFGALHDNLELAVNLPVHGLHLDLVRNAEQLQTVLQSAPSTLTLSLGVIDGRNIWRSDLHAAVALVQSAVRSVGAERVLVAPSCSLLHVPYDASAETEIDDDVRGWLAFAAQKLEEIAAVANVASVQATDRDTALFEQNRAARTSRASSLRVHSPRVAERMNSVSDEMVRRASPFAARRAAQQARLALPVLPTTTIGSFPQTSDVRRTRAGYQRGNVDEVAYNAFLEQEIEQVVRFQEDAGLDVLVHGEPERSDMVEYFAERLDGFAFTRHGWVQSYGSRCVRPPILFGDVARPDPMTVRWSAFAQSLTARPVKGMLTGPVTILQWSFVRDDQSREATCRQIALAIRDEVSDLAAAGLAVIQIDEPALREGMPLRREEQAAYVAWSVACFRLASSGVADDVQIHTHMCYSEFGDMMSAIAAMDADVISIESSRSRMELLQQFDGQGYPNDIGPGVYDIHSPRVPTVEEVTDLLSRALAVLTPAQLWVNPDCGLKTRMWKEVRPALSNMVEAARIVRSRLAVPAD